MKVGIVGGTGPFGRALVQRLVEAGDDVVLGSRSEERATAAATELGASGARNEVVCGGVDLVVLAVDADAALETASALSAMLTAPLLSVASRIEFAGSARPASDGMSLAERVADIVDVPVAAGLHSLAAGRLARGRLDEDVLVCGDEVEAKEPALELAAKVVGGRAIDVGPLAVARALEGMTAAIINVNRRYKAHAGIRLTGVP